MKDGADWKAWITVKRGAKLTHLLDVIKKGWYRAGDPRPPAHTTWICGLLIFNVVQAISANLYVLLLGMIHL